MLSFISYIFVKDVGSWISERMRKNEVSLAILDTVLQIVSVVSLYTTVMLACVSFTRFTELRMYVYYLDSPALTLFYRVGHYGYTKTGRCKMFYNNNQGRAVPLLRLCNDKGAWVWGGAWSQVYSYNIIYIYAIFRKLQKAKNVPSFKSTKIGKQTHSNLIAL